MNFILTLWARLPSRPRWCGGQSLGKAQRPIGSTGALFVVRLLWGVHSLNIFQSAFGLRAGVASLKIIFLALSTG